MKTTKRTPAEERAVAAATATLTLNYDQLFRLITAISSFQIDIARCIANPKTNANRKKKAVKDYEAYDQLLSQIIGVISPLLNDPVLRKIEARDCEESISIFQDTMKAIDKLKPQSAVKSNTTSLGPTNPGGISHG